MASYIIHYIIGRMILEEFDDNYNDFILGNLLPDAHDGTLYGHSQSHFRYMENGEYTKSPTIEYSRFKKKYDDDFDKSLIRGYYCHLLADDKWVRLRIPGYPSNLGNDTEEFFSLRKILHQDFDILNKILADHYQLCIPHELTVPDTLIIQEINKDNVPILLNRLAQHISSTLIGELKIVTTDFILNYINDTVKFCVDSLQNSE